MYFNKTNLPWNSRKVLEVASNHWPIRYKLLTACSPQNRVTKFAGRNMRLYPEILSRWNKQDLQWFCDTISNLLLLEERLSSAFGALSLSPSTPPFLSWVSHKTWWGCSYKRKPHHCSVCPFLSVQLDLNAELLNYFCLVNLANTTTTKHVRYFSPTALPYFAKI